MGCGGVDLVCDLGGAAGTFAGAALVVRERPAPANVSAVVVAGNTQSASPAPPEVANRLLGTPLQKPSGFSKGRSTDTGPCPRAFHPWRYIAFRINNRTTHTATQTTDQRSDSRNDTT